MHVVPWPSAAHRHARGLDIGSASSAKGGVSSSRVIGDAPEDVMADAVRNKQPALVEAVQRVSDFPLNAGEALAIGRVETFVDRHGPDDVGRADRLTRLPQRVEDAARQFFLLKPEIALPDSLRRDRLGLQFRSKQAKRGVKMNEISRNWPSWRSVWAMTPAISARFATSSDATWLSALFHPRSRNDQGDYRPQADVMSAQRAWCVRAMMPKFLDWLLYHVPAAVR